MATKRKPTHYCSQEETIKRINYLLVGNGEPEEGIIFRFSEFMKDHKIVVNDISEIKEGVNRLHERADANQKAAATVASALEKYQAETRQYAAGKTAVEEVNRIKRNLMFTRIVQTITIVIALFMAYIGYRNLNKGQKAIQTEVVKDIK